MALVSQYLDALSAAATTLDRGVVERMAERLATAWSSGQTVFVMGNGGSASTASHLATDFAKLTAPDPKGPRLRTMALTDSVSTITAIGNDFAYEEIFSEQLRTYLSPGDVVIGLSTSGNSKNVLRAISFARSQGAMTYGITGNRGQALQRAAEDTLMIDTDSVQRIEDLSLVAGHIVCLMTRDLCADQVRLQGTATPADERQPVYAQAPAR